MGVCSKPAGQRPSSICSSVSIMKQLPHSEPLTLHVKRNTELWHIHLNSITWQILVMLFYGKMKKDWGTRGSPSTRLLIRGDGDVLLKGEVRDDLLFFFNDGVLRKELNVMDGDSSKWLSHIHDAEYKCQSWHGENNRLHCHSRIFSNIYSI